MSHADVRIQRFGEFLVRSGLKTTRQRERVIRAFFATGRHLSAEELYHRIYAQDRRIGLVTVYRTLKLLREAGLATERQFGETYARFDPNPADQPHDHLICTRCGKIQEFADTRVRNVRRRVARVHGFTVTEHKLELYGLCRECARLEKRRAPRTGKTARAA